MPPALRVDRRSLPSTLMMLALGEGQSRASVENRFMFRVAVAGASLVDLVRLDRLRLSEAQHLFVQDTASTDCPLLDSALGVISRSSERLDADTWLLKLSARPGDLLERSIDDLLQQGVYRLRTRRRLWLFREQRFATPTASPALSSKAQARAVLREGAEPDTSLALVLVLMGACQVLDALLDCEPETVSGRLRELRAGLEGAEDLPQMVSSMRSRVLGFARQSAAAQYGYPFLA